MSGAIDLAAIVRGDPEAVRSAVYARVSVWVESSAKGSVLTVRFPEGTAINFNTGPVQIFRN